MAFLPAHEEAISEKDAHVVGYRRLPQSQRLRKLADGGPFTSRSQDDAENLKSGRISHRTQSAREFFGSTTFEGAVQRLFGSRLRWHTPILSGQARTVRPHADLQH